MEGPSRWRPGDQILVREILRDRVWSARPVTVVEDGPELIAYYMAEGTAWKCPRTHDGNRPSPREALPGASFVVQDATWTGNSVLYLVEPNSQSATLVMWDHPQHVLATWYINLQTPLERTQLGFEYLDRFLDLVMRADKSAWHWKDEDELREAVHLGLLSRQQSGELYAEGRRVLDKLLSCRSPFDRDWSAWRPSPSWPVPVLPKGWDDPSAGK